MFVALWGTVFIAGIVAYISEASRFTHNGYIPSIIIAIGGAFLFYLIRVMFNVSFGSHGLNAIISAIGALILVPTHWRR